MMTNPSTNKHWRGRHNSVLGEEADSFRLQCDGKDGAVSAGHTIAKWPQEGKSSNRQLDKHIPDPGSHGCLYKFINHSAQVTGSAQIPENGLAICSLFTVKDWKCKCAYGELGICDRLGFINHHQFISSQLCAQSVAIRYCIYVYTLVYTHVRLLRTLLKTLITNVHSISQFYLSWFMIPPTPLSLDTSHTTSIHEYKLVLAWAFPCSWWMMSPHRFSSVTSLWNHQSVLRVCHCWTAGNWKGLAILKLFGFDIVGTRETSFVCVCVTWIMPLFNSGRTPSASNPEIGKRLTPLTLSLCFLIEHYANEAHSNRAKQAEVLLHLVNVRNNMILSSWARHHLHLPPHLHHHMPHPPHPNISLPELRECLGTVPLWTERTYIRNWWRREHDALSRWHSMPSISHPITIPSPSLFPSFTFAPAELNWCARWCFWSICGWEYSHHHRHPD